MHVFGPTTPAAFAKWAGIGSAEGHAAFDALAGEVMAVQTPIGDQWILTRDEPSFKASPSPAAPARLLPSGDTDFLLQESIASFWSPTRTGVASWDLARLARRGAGRGRGRWDMATSERSGGDSNVGTPLRRGTTSRRGGGGIPSAARPSGQIVVRWD